MTRYVMTDDALILQVGLSEMQKKYYRALLQKDIDAINGAGDRSRLLNIVMQAWGGGRLVG